MPIVSDGQGNVQETAESIPPSHTTSGNAGILMGVSIIVVAITALLVFKWDDVKKLVK